MGFWLFMLMMNIMIPVVMILIGKMFLKNPPKKINHLYGYRTRRSKQNQKTWDFAHACCGKIWCRVGFALLPACIATMYHFIGKDIDTIALWSTVLCFSQAAVMLLTIVPVERALKQNFDPLGNPIR